MPGVADLCKPVLDLFCGVKGRKRFRHMINELTNEHGGCEFGPVMTEALKCIPDNVLDERPRRVR